MEERAYRKREWKEREERKRLGLDEKEQEQEQHQQQQKQKTVNDYDESHVPADYTMPVATLVAGRLLVGPPCVTQRQQAYVRERLGNPQMILLELPPLEERKLWSTKEATAWYASYAKKIAKKEGTLYMYHETGTDEEAMVGLIIWSIIDAATVPKSHEAFVQWRESFNYLWFLDREIETLLPIALECITANTCGKQNKGLTMWLSKEVKK
jgi:hypothetical protein